MRSIPQDSPSLFDGKVCSKCGSWKPFGDYPQSGRKYLHAYCRACLKAYQARPEAKAKREAYRAAHREENRLREAARRSVQAETIRARRRASRQASPEHARKIARTWRHQHRDHHNEWARAWRQENRVKLRIYEHRRRARENNAPGSHTFDEWQSLSQWFGNVCLSCGATENIQPDHVVPLARGGSNDIANLQPLCATCNQRKGANTIDYRDFNQISRFLNSLMEEVCKSS